MRTISFHYYDVISTVGVIIILVTYYLLQTRKMDARNVWYSILNIVGSVFILYSLWFDWNLGAVLMESFWIVISIVGIFTSKKYH